MTGQRYALQSALPVWCVFVGLSNRVSLRPTRLPVDVEERGFLICIHFTQADWQRRQAAIKLRDFEIKLRDIKLLPSLFSPTSTHPGNSFKEICSFMHIFIPSHLQLSYPSSCPWHTEACGEALVMKQLAFASWKAISVPSTKLRTSVRLP